MLVSYALSEFRANVDLYVSVLLDSPRRPIGFCRCNNLVEGINFFLYGFISILPVWLPVLKFHVVRGQFEWCCSDSVSEYS